MRPRVAMVLAIVAVLLGGVMLVPAAYARLSGGGALASIGGIGGGAENVPAPAPTTPPPPTLAAGPVSVNFKGQFFSWALMDRQTGQISGAANMSQTNSTESMLKAWIVSDYLRQLGDKQPSATLKKQASLAIRDSNDDAANAVYKAAGGSYKAPPGGQPGPVVKRAISICGLTDTTRGNVPGYEGWWSFTRMSPRDAVRMGDCIADGKAAGKWTKWVLNEMSAVPGQRPPPSMSAPAVASGASSTACRPRSRRRARSASRTAGPSSVTTGTGTSTAWRSPTSGASR